MEAHVILCIAGDFNVHAKLEYLYGVCETVKAGNWWGRVYIVEQKTMKC